MTRRTIVLVVGLVVLVPALAGAQEWSPAQREVWDFEQSCWADPSIEFVDRCFHEDFLGWGVNGTVPTNRADRKTIFTREFAIEDQVYLFLKPVAVTVHGDMATAMYIVTFTTRNKETGVEETTTERWTDVLVKDGGQWSWIADHGVDISTN